MSEYQKHQICYAYEDELVAGLEVLYGKGNVELHKTPQVLVDYHGNTRPGQVANVIVRRRHISPMANDIGFLKDENGVYSTFYVSDYDSVYTAGGSTLKNLSGVYLKMVTENRLTRGRYILKKEENNQITYRVVR